MDSPVKRRPMTLGMYRQNLRTLFVGERREFPIFNLEMLQKEKTGQFRDVNA